MYKKQRIPVKCQTCCKEYTKTKETLVYWNGDCADCALDKRRGRPKAREAVAGASK